MRWMLICVAILAFAGYAQEWIRLEDVPVPEQKGSCIVYSYDEWGTRPYDTVWGIFPSGIPQDGKTYFLYYDCGNGHWYFPHDSMLSQYYLENTAITFQWLEGGVVYVVGNEGATDILYSYSLSSGQCWHRKNINEFNIGARPGLAFVPNPNYNRMLYPVPGCLYCLPGGGSQHFWRYWIPSVLEPIAVDGIYPGQGAIIADRHRFSSGRKLRKRLNIGLWWQPTPTFSLPSLM